MDAGSKTTSGTPIETDTGDRPVLNFDGMPPSLAAALRDHYRDADEQGEYLEPGVVYHGDAVELIPRIKPGSVALSVWSPLYWVGKKYEKHLDYEAWENLLAGVIKAHFSVLKPGGFLAVNIADILCFKDQTMPRISADVASQKRCAITREDVLRAMAEHPGMNRRGLAKILGCSEQTVDRRLHGVNIRGGKYETQTRVKIVGGLVEKWALDAGLYPYDRRIWVKDPAWANSRWASTSYRAVDEWRALNSWCQCV